MNIVEIKKKEGLIDSWKFLWERRDCKQVSLELLILKICIIQ